MKIQALCLALLMVSTMAAATEIDLKAYEKCTEYAESEQVAPPEAEAVCLGPAKQGSPGAQYALGAILLSHQKYQDGLQWLEKAAAAKLPPAAHLLGSIYVQTKDAARQARGRDLLTFAICSGYPPSQEQEVKTAAGNPKCAQPSAPFDGTWTGQLTWVKPSPSSKTDQLRVTVQGSSVKVLMHSGDKWTEVKPGRFAAQQVDDTLYISTLDSGWDFDGKWIETWTIHLLRTSDNQATMHFLRTVNNIYVPESTGLRTFSTVAEGSATRAPL